jgi:hypothetical protein
MADAKAAPSPPLWQWIPLSEYQRPAPPFQHHVGRLWSWGGTPAETEPSAATPRAPQQRAALHHTIEEELADSLEQHLAAWFADPQATPRLVVLPPHLGVESVMRRVALSVRWRVLDPPPSAEILTDGDACRGRLMELGDAPIVVPALHRVFLRHADGMDRLRELLTFLCRRRVRALVGCESWGWLYVRKVLQLDAVFGEPLTLNAFDADRLAERLPDAGGVMAGVLRQLAAESGGNVVVASALAARVVQSGTSPDDASVTAPLLWRSRLPAWPPESGSTETFVAHSLLVHGGLPADALATTILATGDEIRAGVERLAAAGLIEETHGIWRVTPLGYPAVRTHLIGHGYADDF